MIMTVLMVLNVKEINGIRGIRKVMTSCESEELCCLRSEINRRSCGGANSEFCVDGQKICGVGVRN